MATNRDKSKKAKITFGNGTGSKVSVSWSSANAQSVTRLIDICNDCGCAPSFSVTQDGGAWRLYFLHESIEKSERSQYCAGTADIDEWLAEWIDFWEGYRDEQIRS